VGQTGLVLFELRWPPGMLLVGRAESTDVWCAAQGVRGLFVDRPGPVELTFELLGCQVAGRLGEMIAIGNGYGRLGNGELRLLGVEGPTVAVGRFLVGGLTILGHRPSFDDPTLLDLDVRGLVFDPPSRETGVVWQAWRGGRPARRNMWADYGPQGRRAWLRIAGSHHHARAGGTPDKPVGTVYQLDGSQIRDEPGVFCALGEAINGPGGYFGASLDGLNDCLRGGYGAGAPFTLIWTDSPQAHTHLTRRLDDAGQRSFFDAVLKVLRDHGVHLDLR
jgi:RNAse (barnase) inhibitor barstar